MAKFYLDTSIWIDLIEDRIGFNKEPLGKYAYDFLIKIKSQNNEVFISDVVIKELKSYLKNDIIIGIINIFKPLFIESNEKQRYIADKLSKRLDLPTADVLHAIIAKDYGLILITRDNHFKKLKFISKPSKPEDLI